MGLVEGILAGLLANLLFAFLIAVALLKAGATRFRTALSLGVPFHVLASRRSILQVVLSQRHVVTDESGLNTAAGFFADAQVVASDVLRRHATQSDGVGAVAHPGAQPSSAHAEVVAILRDREAPGSDRIHRQPLCAPSEFRAYSYLANLLAPVRVDARIKLSDSFHELDDMFVTLGGPGLNPTSRAVLARARGVGADIKLNPEWGDKYLSVGGRVFRQQVDEHGQVTVDYGLVLLGFDWRGQVSLGLGGLRPRYSGRHALLLGGIGGLGTEAAASVVASRTCSKHLQGVIRNRQWGWLVVQATGAMHVLQTVDIVERGAVSVPTSRGSKG